MEGTNPFLSLTFATLRMGLKDSAWLPIYTLLLMISFLTLRIASLPAAYIALVLDVADHGLRSDDLYRCCHRKAHDTIRATTVITSILTHLGLIFCIITRESYYCFPLDCICVLVLKCCAATSR